MWRFLRALDVVDRDQANAEIDPAPVPAQHVVRVTDALIATSADYRFAEGSKGPSSVVGRRATPSPSTTARSRHRALRLPQALIMPTMIHVKPGLAALHQTARIAVDCRGFVRNRLPQCNAAYPAACAQFFCPFSPRKVGCGHPQQMQLIHGFRVFVDLHSRDSLELFCRSAAQSHRPCGEMPRGTSSHHQEMNMKHAIDLPSRQPLLLAVCAGTRRLPAIAAASSGTFIALGTGSSRPPVVTECNWASASARRVRWIDPGHGGVQDQCCGTSGQWQSLRFRLVAGHGGDAR